jgi:hypothetical protein
MAFDNAEFDGFDRGNMPKVMYAGMLQYDGDLALPKRFLVEPPKIKHTLSEFCVNHGINSYAVSETQKYGHVTYFWNGNRSEKFSDTLETWEEIESDKVSFDQRPWMKSAEVTDAVIKAIESGKYQFIRCNYPNGDMVGHTGSLEATIIGVEAVDLALQRLLPVIDKEIGRSIKMTLEKKGVDVHVASPVKKIEKDGDKLAVVLTNKKGEEVTVKADKVLMCVGRRPNTADVFSEEFLARYPEIKDAKGFIPVDDKYRTVCPSIYAIGDCIGGVQLAHVAAAEGRNAVALMNGKEAAINMGTVPSCIYTEPEIAVVGMTADEAKAAGIDVVSKKYPMSANGKTIIAGLDRGFVKLVARADDHTLIGAHMLCGRATDLIAELAVAIGRGMTLEEVANIIHPHPSFAEAIMEAARL